MVQVFETPPPDAVALGGWAGIPLLAEVLCNTKDLVPECKRSMPHHYSDRKLEEEERQQLFLVRVFGMTIKQTQKAHGNPDRGVACSDLEKILPGINQDGTIDEQKCQSICTNTVTTKLRNCNLEDKLPLICRLPTSNIIIESPNILFILHCYE